MNKRLNFNVAKPYEAISTIVPLLFLSPKDSFRKIYDDEGNVVEMVSPLNFYCDPRHLFGDLPDEIHAVKQDENNSIERLKNFFEKAISLRKEAVSVEDFGKFFYIYGMSSLATIASKYGDAFFATYKSRAANPFNSKFTSVFAGISEICDSDLHDMWERFIKDHTNYIDDDATEEWFKKFNYLINMEGRVENFNNDNIAEKTLTLINVLFYTLVGAFMKYFDDQFFFFINLDEDNEPTVDKQIKMIMESNMPGVKRLVRMCFIYNAIYEMFSDHTGYVFNDSFHKTLNRIGKFAAKELRSRYEVEYEALEDFYSIIDEDNFAAYSLFYHSSNFSFTEETVRVWAKTLIKGLPYSDERVHRAIPSGYEMFNRVTKRIDYKSGYKAPLIKRLSIFEKVDPIKAFEDITDYEIEDYVIKATCPNHIVNPAYLNRLVLMATSLRMYLSYNKIEEDRTRIKYNRVLNMLDVKIMNFIIDSDDPFNKSEILKRIYCPIVKFNEMNRPYREEIGECEDEIQGIIIRYLEATHYLFGIRMNYSASELKTVLENYQNVDVLSRDAIYDTFAAENKETLLREINSGKVPFCLFTMKDNKHELKADFQTLKIYLKLLGFEEIGDEANSVNPLYFNFRNNYFSIPEDVASEEKVKDFEANHDPEYGILGKYYTCIYYLLGESANPYEFFRKLAIL